MDIQDSATDRSTLIQTATYISVGVAIVLIIIKCGAWLTTGSMSLKISLIDSVSDAVASVINLFAVREALRPADREHRFGHGKIEALAALGQSAFIVGSALFLMVEATRRLFIPNVIEQPQIGIIVMVISIVLSLALVIFQKYVVHVTKSTAIKADATHYQADMLMNIGVLVALGAVQWLQWNSADALISLFIGSYILYSAWTITSEAFHILIDRELPEEQRQHIKNIVGQHEKVMGIHDLRTRSAGQQCFVQLHLELDGHLTLNDTHTIADEVTTLIVKEFPHAEVIIHQDPHHSLTQRQRVYQ